MKIYEWKTRGDPYDHKKHPFFLGIDWLVLFWIIAISILFGACIYAIHQDNINRPKWEAAVKKAHQDEIAKCVDEGGSWTWGYFPVGIHGQSVRIEFCEKSK